MPSPALPRSEDVDEILAQIPNWPLRWGISLLFSIVLLLLGLAWFVKYPDVLKGKITITTIQPPVTVVTRISGPVHLLVDDKSIVSANQSFASIGGTAVLADVLILKKTLLTFEGALATDNIVFDTRLFSDKLMLGDLQIPYNVLLLRWNEWQALSIRSHSNQQRKGIVNNQIDGLDQISDRLQRQLDIQETEYRLLRQAYEARYKPLYRSGSISAEQLEAKRDELLSKSKAIEAAQASITENQNRITGMQSQKAEYDFDQTDRQLAARNNLHDGVTNLLNAIATWETTYILKTPVAGRLNYLNFMHENSSVMAGQEIATIVPTVDTTTNRPRRNLTGYYVGELFIEPSGSGKVEVGQLVHITLSSFSKKEFGMLRGRVATVADVSSTLNQNEQPQIVYKLYVTLPDQLTTTVNKKLPFRYGMEGTAEVITKDRRLLERIFSSILATFSS